MELELAMKLDFEQEKKCKLKGLSTPLRNVPVRAIARFAGAVIRC